MKSSRGPRAALVVGSCWLLTAITVVFNPHDCTAQDSPPIVLQADPGGIDSDFADEPPMLDEIAMFGAGCYPCCPWQVWANAIFMSRSSTSRQPLVYKGPKGSRYFWTDDLDFDYGWGPSLGITFCFNRCNPYNRIGAEFYAVDGWSSTEQVAGNISVQFPSTPYLPNLEVPGDPLSGYGVATFRYTSSLYNTEVNFYHQSRKVRWLSTLAGFRWIDIGEDFRTDFVTGDATPHYTIDVNNHLYGFQVGALANLQDYGPWRFEGWLKAGAYGSMADQHTTEDFTSAGGSVIYAAADSTNLAFAGDLGVSVSRRITDHLSLRLSYMALWIDGIALAPEQLDNTDPSNSNASLDDSGGTFYHGGFLGGEFLW